jgi:hypothetical protein
LAPIAVSTTHLSGPARAFRSALAEQKDPIQLLFGEILTAVEGDGSDAIAAQLRALRTEIEEVPRRARREAADVLRKTLEVGLDRRESSLADTCQKWTKCFSVQDLRSAGSAAAIAFINRLEQRYDSDDLFLDSIASQLVGQPVTRWDDGTLSKFERALSDAVRAVEEEAVRLAVSGAANPVVVNNLSRLIEARIRALYDSLGKISGEGRARDAVLRLATISMEEAKDGNDSRSAR